MPRDELAAYLLSVQRSCDALLVPAEVHALICREWVDPFPFVWHITSGPWVYRDCGSRPTLMFHAPSTGVRLWVDDNANGYFIIEVDGGVVERTIVYQPYLSSPYPLSDPVDWAATRPTDWRTETPFGNWHFMPPGAEAARAGRRVPTLDDGLGGAPSLLAIRNTKTGTKERIDLLANGCLRFAKRETHSYNPVNERRKTMLLVTREGQRAVEGAELEATAFDWDCPKQTESYY